MLCLTRVHFCTPTPTYQGQPEWLSVCNHVVLSCYRQVGPSGSGVGKKMVRRTVVWDGKKSCPSPGRVVDFWNGDSDSPAGCRCGGNCSLSYFDQEGRSEHTQPPVARFSRNRQVRKKSVPAAAGRWSPADGLSETAANVFTHRGQN